MQRVEDDHKNIVSMGGRTVGPAVGLVQTFLAAELNQVSRHLGRLGKVTDLERTMLNG